MRTMGRSLLREQWERHREQLYQLRSAAIDTAWQWAVSVEDPEDPHMGRRLENAMAETHCKERINIFHQSGVASYTAFSLYQDDPAFINQLTYGPMAEEDLGQLFTNMVHEKAHALQTKNCAALHANPYNRNTRIVLCPRDWLLIQEKAEQHAYVVQAFFASVIAKEFEEMRELTKYDVLSVDDVDTIRQQTFNLAEARVEAARQALGKRMAPYDDGNRDTFYDSYHRESLKAYKTAMTTRWERGDYSTIFVRLEAEDIAAIGETLGMNCFGAEGVMDPDFETLAPLNEKNARALREMNHACGIVSESALPTLSEALASMGMTRQDMMDHTYGRKNPALHAAPRVEVRIPANV